MGSIKSAQTFEKVFPDVTIIAGNTFKTAQWSSSNEAHKKKIFDWISAHAHRWLETYNVLPKIYNEVSLYPYIFDILKSIVALNNNLVLESRVEKEFTDESIDSAVDSFILHQSQNSSFSSVDFASAEVTKREIPSLPLQVDTSNKAEVKQLFMEMERWLSHEESGGRVEFTVLDGSNVKCVLEVKLSVASDFEQGFYQACSSLLAAQAKHQPPVTYGVYTDFRNWTFLKLEKNVITKSHEMGLFEIFRMKFQRGAYSIFAYLLEIFDIPVTVKMQQSTEAAEAVLAEELKELLSGLK